MKVVKAKEMARIEKLAYAKGASEEGFMEQAGAGVAELAAHIAHQLDLEKKVALLCGSGNNGGDAYVAGRLLIEKGFQVKAFALAPHEKSSPLCQLQCGRFLKAGGQIDYVKAGQKLHFEAALIIDGILGTGFHGEVEGLLREVIAQANQSGLPIIAVDVPSGINGTTGAVGGIAIEASDTLFLGLPKAGCFYEEAWNYVGNPHVFDFGLGKENIDQAAADFILVDMPLIRDFLPKLKRTRHKYQAGYVVGLGGCPGMPGAPIMASFASLRAGAGIVRLMHPVNMAAELASAPYEVIKEGYEEGKSEKILEAMQRASALFVGPGLGTSPSAVQILREILPTVNKPCVIDADALTLLSGHEMALPPQTILTPHHGEMKRLLKTKEELTFQNLLEQSQSFVDRKKVTLVLKGAPTFIFHPDHKPYICARGDPGMATAGSGDVLTGIISAFLAQTKDTLKAAILGVQLHAIAGEYAAQKETSYCMTATDIMRALPKAFKEVLGTRKTTGTKDYM